MLRPFVEFAQIEASGGILLFLFTLVALVWANSPWSETYSRIWQTRLTFGLGDFVLSKPLLLWINDGLMAIFFFVVGLEIKREFLVGELSSPQKASLPIVAALGGMLVPAGIYALFNAGEKSIVGWGIPMATDIAFALGVMALLGNRVPMALKVFVTALAVVDDIGAVLIIALFYTSQIYWSSLAIGGLLLAILVLANLLGVRSPLVYTLLGIGLWLAFLKSGVHATIAGVLLAMTIPCHSQIDNTSFTSQCRKFLDAFERASESGARPINSEEQQAAIQALEVACERVETPLQRMEHSLHPWVAYLILPLFALANAGVTLGEGLLSGFANPVTLGVIAGLVIGKPLGVVLFSWIAVRLRIAVSPASVSWSQMHGAGWLTGIGFTMSLFISGLAFESPELQSAAKLGILTGSLLAGSVGWSLLRKAR